MHIKGANAAVLLLSLNNNLLNKTKIQNITQDITNTNKDFINPTYNVIENNSLMSPIPKKLFEVLNNLLLKNITTNKNSKTIIP